ncbi:MAG: hypothetical protein ABWK53_00195 [Anaerolineales bacterium]
MSDSNLPYSLPPSEPRLEPSSQKHSVLGIASFVLVILAMLVICLDMVLIFSLSGGLQVDPAYNWIDVAFSCLGGIMALVALGLGIGAVAQKDTKKIFGILGIIFSALFLLGYCVIITFNLIRTMGSM